MVGGTGEIPGRFRRSHPLRMLVVPLLYTAFSASKRFRSLPQLWFASFLMLKKRHASEMCLNPDEANQTKLRRMCQLLPIQPVVPSSRLKSGKREYMKNEQIRCLIKRQLKEKEARSDPHLAKAAQQAINLVAHAFWATGTKGRKAALHQEGLLNPCALLGLHSALQVGVTVVLWTYHLKWANLALNDFGSRLQVKDASEVVPLDEFMGMLANNWTWGNIADVIRFKAAHMYNSTGSFVIDLDTVWIRTPTVQNCPSVSGHRFATCAARPRVSEDVRYWQHRYLQKPEHRSYNLPPFYFPAHSEVLSALQDTLYTWGKPPKMYTHWLDKLEALVIEKGFNLDFQDVDTFHPVHNWVKYMALASAEQPQTAHYGYPFRPAEFVLGSSVAFNNPWQTSMPQKGGTVWTRSNLRIVHSGIKSCQACNCLQMS